MMGTIENSNCLSCDSPYYPKYEDTLKNETYVNCYQKIEGYSLYNNQYFVKYCFKTCDICLKNGNSTILTKNSIVIIFAFSTSIF